MLAIVSPGQGAQKPGFLTPWLESFGPKLAWWSAVSGIDLSELGTNADAERIRDTAVAQPLLTAAALGAFAALDPDRTLRPIVAGHSVGEIAAACLAGVISPESAMVFVRERGAAMARAAATEETGMSAVLAGQLDDVIGRIESCGLTAANHNGRGQIVVAGTREQLEQLAAAPPARSRIVPLQVAGAFHTHHMQPATERLEDITEAMPVHDPQFDYVSNLDGATCPSGRDIVERLVRQVTRPVRWDLCMERMTQLGVTGLLELPPAGTLTGIAKRNMDVELFALNEPDQLDEAREFCARHND